MSPFPKFAGALLAALLAIGIGSAIADNSAPNQLDPNAVYTPEQLEQLALEWAQENFNDASQPSTAPPLTLTHDGAYANETDGTDTDATDPAAAAEKAFFVCNFKVRRPWKDNGKAHGRTSQSCSGENVASQAIGNCLGHFQPDGDRVINDCATKTKRARAGS